MADHFEQMDLDEVPPGTLARVLATTDGTVATILEAYVGEPVCMVKLAERFEPVGAQNPDLPVEPGERVLRRTILLQGQQSGTNFLFAESLIRADRLHREVVEALVTTATPLRRILSEHRIGSFEEMIGGDREPAGRCGLFFGVDPDAAMITRRYRILVGGEPVIVITERFPVERFS